VRWWSDFNRVYYHPRSAIQFNQYQLDISSFDAFTQGLELFHEVDKVVLPHRTDVRTMTFSTEMFAHLWRKAIRYKDSRFSSKAIRHGLDLVQIISVHYAANTRKSQYGHGVLKPKRSLPCVVAHDRRMPPEN
jgi:Tubulin domain